MAATVDVVNLYIDYSGGKRTLNEVSAFSVNPKQERRLVHTINKRRVARGVRSGPKEVSGSITVAMMLDPEVDWNALLNSGEAFTLGFERGSGGQRFQIVNMVVTDINETHNAEGDPSWEVSYIGFEVRRALA